MPLPLAELFSRLRLGVSVSVAFGIVFAAAVPGAASADAQRLQKAAAHQISGKSVAAPAVALPLAAPAISFTSPSASVAAAPKTASLAVPGLGGTFYVPYIQASPTLDVSLAHTGPAKESVVDVTLDAGTPNEREVRVLSAPWQAQFDNLTYGEHTLTAKLYVLPAGFPKGVALPESPVAEASLDHVARGDIVAALGDSTTEGLGNGPWQPADMGLLGAYSDWNAAAAALGATHPDWMTSDQRNFPQVGATLHPASRPSFTVALARQLEAERGHPVLVLNEGWSGTTSDGYMRISTSTSFAALVAATHPTDWLINLGANDPLVHRAADEYSARMQSLVSNLEGLYGAPAASIHVACPSFTKEKARQAVEATYLAGISQLRAANGLGAGPDFWSYYQAHPEAIADAVHPNSSGYAAMAVLWAGALAGHGGACG